MMKTAHRMEFGGRDFGRKVLSALTRKGVAIVGATYRPGRAGDYLNGERCYEVSDNETHRIWTYAQVCAAGNAPLSYAPAMPDMTVVA